MSNPRITADPTWIFPIVLLVGAVIAVGWWWWRNSQADRLRWFQQGQLKDRHITVVLAVSAAEVQQGLSDRASIGADAMYFTLQPHPDHRFWMYRMQFPLDFVWVYEGQVVALHENVPIPRSENRQDIATVEPDVMVDGVLELPSGTIQQYKIQVGDSWLLTGDRTRKVW